MILRRHPTPKKLASLYTPTEAEKALAQRMTRTPFHCLGLLVLLKTFKRLGYALALTQIPGALIAHIATATDLAVSNLDWPRYDRSKARKRHLALVREYWHITPYRQQGRKVMEQALTAAAQTKQDLVEACKTHDIPEQDSLPAEQSHSDRDSSSGK